MTFTVPGKPKGKDRPRGKNHYTPKATREYEAKVRACYKLQGGGMISEDGPLSIRVLILHPIPKRTPKLRRQQMLQGLIRPMKTPDGDNVMKIVDDALNGVAYKDDRQLVDGSWRTFYAPEDRAGIIVTIEEASYDEQEIDRDRIGF